MEEMETQAMEKPEAPELLLMLQGLETQLDDLDSSLKGEGGDLLPVLEAGRDSLSEVKKSLGDTENMIEEQKILLNDLQLLVDDLIQQVKD